MKRIQLLALGALLSLAGQIAYPYAIVNDKASDAAATIYVFAGADKYLKYLKARGVPDAVLPYVTKAAAAIGAAGLVAAPETAGLSLVAEAAPIAATAANAINIALKQTGLLDQGVLKLAGVIAVHKDVVPGNRGRGAEYNWADIQKSYGVPQGGTLFVVITDKKNGDPLLQTTLASNGILGFTIKKNNKGQLVAEQSAAAASQYEPSSIKSEAETLWSRIKGQVVESYENLTNK